MPATGVDQICQRIVQFPQHELGCCFGEELEVEGATSKSFCCPFGGYGVEKILDTGDVSSH